MAVVSLDSVLRRRAGVLSTRVDDELVLLDDSTSTYHGLDSVGARVWEQLDGGVTLRAICDRLSAEFEVDWARCEREVLAFSADLAQVGLVEVAAP